MTLKFYRVRRFRFAPQERAMFALPRQVPTDTVTHPLSTGAIDHDHMGHLQVRRLQG